MARTTWGLIAVLLTVLAGLSGCGSDKGRSTEIQVGLLASLSGDPSQNGQQTVQAAELLVKAVNQAGGLTLGGRKHRLVLVVEDDQGNPQAAVAAAQKLINQKGVMVLVGPQRGPSAIPVARLAEKARIPMISPTSTNPETTAGKSYVFRAVCTETLQGQALGRFARHDLAADKAAVLFDAANVYNRALAQVFKEAFVEAGGEVAGFEFYTTGERDFTAQLERIKAAEAELLFLPNSAADAPLQISQAGQVGLKTIFLGSDSWADLAPADWPAVEGAYFSAMWPPHSQDEANRRFVEAYAKAYGQPPQAAAALTYDALGLVVAALKAAGQADPESLRANLAKIKNYPGLSGTISFQDSGDPLKSVTLLKVNRGRPEFFKALEPTDRP